MKKLMDKNFIQKTVIAILIVLSFNFVMPTFSSAGFGGVLMGPVIDLIAGLGDSVMALLQYFMDGTAISTNPLSSGGFMIREDYFDKAIMPKENENDPDVLIKDQYDLEVSQEDENSLKKITIKSEDLDTGWFHWLFGATTYNIPILQYSPERIFSNNVPALDANFINPKDWGDTNRNEKSIARALQETISGWYVSLRNLVIVCLLSILLYVAIRMIISSVAADKAKYKQMLVDWLVALCLLFFLHYIMSFTMTLVEIITESLGNGTEVIIDVTGKDPVKFKTTLTGACRMQVQYSDLGTRLVYLIFYIALVIYTVKFTWEYIKRAITLAFLTLIAPLVTLTYPIDKMNDGKAQAFNAWLKEFVFNALLQPFHLIVYTIFLGAGMDIAVNNPIYAILCLAFITPAEKLLRKFFGFDKASSAGASFAGGFGGAAAFSAIKGAVSKGASALSGNSGGSKGGSSGGNVRTKKALPANNGPKGLEAFAGNQNGKDSEENNNIRKNNNATGIDNSESSKTAQQRMLDAYDENYGTDEYDPQEREAMVREAYSGNNELEQNVDNQRGVQSAAQSANNKSAKGNGRTIKGAIGGALKYTGRKLQSRFATKEGWKKNLRFVGRTAARAAGLGIGATVGLAAGITGDGLEDVLKYGAAGTALGTKTIGDGIIGSGRRISNSGIAQATREGYYGSVDAAQAARNRSLLKDAGEIREYIGNNITDENGKRLSNKALTEYEERAIEHYNAGITDYSEIKNTLKLEDNIRKELTNLPEEERNNLARRQAETVAKYAKSFNDDKFETDEKYRAKKREEFAVGIRNVNSNLSEKQVKDNSEQMIKRICEYKKLTYRKD